MENKPESIIARIGIQKYCELTPPAAIPVDSFINKP